MRVDLHLHSTTSDGSLSPRALMHAARAGGLDVVALTDHDTVGGIAEARRAAVGLVHLIAGIELSTSHGEGEQHILGYYVDETMPRLRDYTAAASQRREERMHGMIERLAEAGVAISYEAVRRSAELDTRSIGRPHLARALVEHGHVSTMGEAFERYIGDAGPGYLPVQLISAQDAITLIHDAGGVAVWAHPRPERFDREIDGLAAHGLDGVECFRPRCLPLDSLRMEAAARERGLFVTGGSDWHGLWHGRLGEFAVGRDEVATFLERGGI